MQDDQIQATLPDWTEWYLMVENSTIPASRSANRSTSRTWLAHDIEWHFLSPAKWLFLANVASRSTTMENRLSLSPFVANEWHLGTLEQTLTWKGAFEVWKETSVEHNHSGQSIYQDFGRRFSMWFWRWQAGYRQKKVLTDSYFGIGGESYQLVICKNVGAKLLLKELATQVDTIKHLKLIWVDGSYRDLLIDWVAKYFGWKLLKNQKIRLDFKFFQNDGS